MCFALYPLTYTQLRLYKISNKTLKSGCRGPKVSAYARLQRSPFSHRLSAISISFITPTEKGVSRSHSRTRKGLLHLYCFQAGNIRYIPLPSWNVGNLSSNPNGSRNQHFPAFDFFESSISDPTLVPIYEGIQAPTFDPFFFPSSEQLPNAPQNLIAPQPNFVPFDESFKSPVLNPFLPASSSGQPPVTPQEPPNSRDNADAPYACEHCNKTFRRQCDLK